MLSRYAQELYAILGAMPSARTEDDDILAHYYVRCTPDELAQAIRELITFDLVETYETKINGITKRVLQPK